MAKTALTKGKKIIIAIAAVIIIAAIWYYAMQGNDRD